MARHPLSCRVSCAVPARPLEAKHWCWDSPLVSLACLLTTTLRVKESRCFLYKLRTKLMILNPDRGQQEGGRDQQEGSVGHRKARFLLLLLTCNVCHCIRGPPFAYSYTLLFNDITPFLYPHYNTLWTHVRCRCRRPCCCAPSFEMFRFVSLLKSLVFLYSYILHYTLLVT